MASEKKAVILYTNLEGKQILGSELPGISKLKNKGAVCTNASSQGGDRMMFALAGHTEGQSLVDALLAEDLIVERNALVADQEFDLAVLTAPDDVAALDAQLVELFDAIDRQTVLVLIAKDALFFHGYGILRGAKIETKICPCSVATTIAYITDFPVPVQAEAPILYGMLKEQFKRREYLKSQETLQHMESALERKGRQPWDKHDCA